MDWEHLDGLLLDLDGTLADTERLHLQAHRQVLEEQGILVEDSEIVRNVGGHDRAFYLELQERHGVPGDIEHWLADKEAAVWRAISSGAVEAMPGAHALIGAAAQRDVSCVVVTNSARIVAEAVLEGCGLAAALPHRVCWEDTVEHKPHPAPYLRGLGLLNADPTRVHALEDSIPGVRSATAAGLRCIGCAGYVEPEALRTAGAWRVVSGLDEVLP